MKHLLTQPRPISSGGTGFATGSMTVDGVALSSPLGDTGGVAFVQNGMMYVSVISPSSDFGTNLDYPFLTITMDIPPSAVPGSTTNLELVNSAFTSPDGPLTLTEPKPGVLTIGGTISVRGVYPGGGTWPAGTVIRVEGTGFEPGTKIATKMKTSTPVYVSAKEMRFTLQQTAALDEQPIQATNPDGSQVTYYSYLRGVPVQRPLTPMLQSAEPVFPLNTQITATVGPLPVMRAGQFAALAVQNPNPGNVSVVFHLQRTGTSTTIALPSGGRLMDSLSALLDGVRVGAADVVTVSATAGVQVLGIYGDSTASTLTPFLPSF